jgi:GH35 family endo-1,4-beta-xylanase
MKTCKIFFFALFGCLTIHSTYAQFPGINDSIAKYRKGKITVLARKGDKVSVEQLSHEFWFGCAISNSLVSGRWAEADRNRYKEKFLENFNSAVTENALKWPDMESERGKVNYAIVDGILKWTEENNIPLRGHNIFWGIPNRVQPWLKEMGDEELRQILQNRAETITSKYKGRFAEYDLNNEMIHANFYEERLGSLITRDMAQWAHNGDPEAKLYLNDYDILTGNRLDDYLAHIRKLLSQGVSIAGIGVQGHLHTETFDRNELRRSLDSLYKFRLPVKITEFNIPGQRSKFHTEKITTMTAPQEEFNAKELTDYYRICFAHPAVKGILMWGFWAGSNWIPVSSMYRLDWSETPSVQAYQNLVFKEWWTKEDGTASNKGAYTVSGFYGKYRITVNGESREAVLDSQKGSLTVEFTK